MGCDFFNCKVNITADDRNVYIGFYPLLTDLECVALTEKKKELITFNLSYIYINSSNTLTSSELSK
jgi:hypothetical protein